MTKDEVLNYEDIIKNTNDLIQICDRFNWSDFKQSLTAFRDEITVQRETHPELFISAMLVGNDPDKLRMLKNIRQIVHRLCLESNDGFAKKDDIIMEAEIEGMESTTIKRTLNRLEHDEEVYQKIDGKYQFTAVN